MTVLIAHRGNMTGPNPERENHPDYIQEALQAGFDVEVDAWADKDSYGIIRWSYGHDKPQYQVAGTLDGKAPSDPGPHYPKAWTDLINPKVWVHCKNLMAFQTLISLNDASPLGCHFFWHQNDDFALTSCGHIWTYPGQPLTYRSIYVLPETITQDYWVNPSYPFGICSDNVAEYKKQLEGKAQ